MTATTRCKLRCTSINPSTHRFDDGSEGSAAMIAFTAVFARNPDGSGQACEENKIFGQWTPSASFSMYVCNPNVLRMFETGGEYYFDISRAPDTPLRDYPWVPSDEKTPPEPV